jgi:hypothetical protein
MLYPYTLLAPLSMRSHVHWFIWFQTHCYQKLAVRTSCCQPTVASRSGILDEQRGIEVLISFIFAYFFKTAMALVS